MISKMRSMTFVLLLIMLFSGVVNGRSEDMVTDMRIDRWFTNLFYPPVYDPSDIDHAVPGSTKWFDYKKGLPDRTSNALLNKKLAYNLFDESKKPPAVPKPKVEMVVSYEDKLAYDVVIDPADPVPVIPVIPEHFADGTLNTYGYGWIYLPSDITGLTYSKEYFDAVKAYVASSSGGAVPAGVGPLY